MRTVIKSSSPAAYKPHFSIQLLPKRRKRTGSPVLFLFLCQSGVGHVLGAALEEGGEIVRHRLNQPLPGLPGGPGHVRGEQAVPGGAQELPARPPHQDPEELFITREERRERLGTLKGQLSSLEADILDLYLRGYSYGEIAERVDRSTKAVDNAVQRIRRKVARHVSSGDLSES